MDIVGEYVRLLGFKQKKSWNSCTMTILNDMCAPCTVLPKGRKKKELTKKKGKRTAKSENKLENPNQESEKVNATLLLISPI